MNCVYPVQGHRCFLFPEEISVKRKENHSLTLMLIYCAVNSSSLFLLRYKSTTFSAHSQYVTIWMYILYLDPSMSKCFLSTDINYFHCIRIVELLKVSESATKNIFGGYSSKRMKVCISMGEKSCFSMIWRQKCYIVWPQTVVGPMFWLSDALDE